MIEHLSSFMYVPSNKYTYSLQLQVHTDVHTHTRPGMIDTGLTHTYAIAMHSLHM